MNTNFDHKTHPVEEQGTGKVRRECSLLQKKKDDGADGQILLLNIKQSLNNRFEKFDIFKDFPYQRKFEGESLYSVLDHFPIRGEVGKVVILGLWNNESENKRIARFMEVLNPVRWKVSVMICSDKCKAEIDRILPTYLLDSYDILNDEEVKFQPELVKEFIDRIMGS